MATKMIREFASSNEIPQVLRDCLKGKKRLDKNIYLKFVEYLDGLDDREMQKLKKDIIREGKLVYKSKNRKKTVEDEDEEDDESDEDDEGDEGDAIDVAINEAVAEAVADVVEDTIEGRTNSEVDIKKLIESSVEGIVKSNINKYMDENVKKYIEEMLNKKMSELNSPMESKVKHLTTVLEMLNKNEVNPPPMDKTEVVKQAKSGIDRFAMKFRKP